MATRRSLGMGGERDDDSSFYGEDNYDQPVGTSIRDEGGNLLSLDQLFGLSGQSPQAGDPFGTQPADPMEPLIDRSQVPGGPMDDRAEGGREAGSTERPREFMPSPAPTTYQQQQPGPADYGIPEGVSVEPDAFSGVPDSSNSLVTPLAPQAPSPAVMSGQPPSVMAGESGTGPQRRTITASSAPSRMFAPRRQSALLGAAGGLNEGGLGVPGSGSGGPVQPTELMKALMAALRTG